MNTARYHRDRRRHERVHAAGRVRYQFGHGLHGEASVVNADYGGMSLRVPRPFKAGQRLMLEVSAPGKGATFEVKGFVVWCAPEETAEEAATYRLGVRVYHDQTDSLKGLCLIMGAGRRGVTNGADRRVVRFRFTDWRRTDWLPESSSGLRRVPKAIGPALGL